MNKDRHCGTSWTAVRYCLATVLLLALLASAFPSVTWAAVPTCTLACCAGMPAHAAGSCMGGSCHAGLLKHERTTPVAATGEGEPLCGLSSQQTISIPTIIADTSDDELNVDQPHLNSSALTKPCLLECGACTSASFSLNRRVPIAARTADAINADLRSSYINFSAATARLSRPALTRYSPRGPPA